MHRLVLYQRAAEASSRVLKALDVLNTPKRTRPTKVSGGDGGGGETLKGCGPIGTNSQYSSRSNQ